MEIIETPNHDIDVLQKFVWTGKDVLLIVLGIFIFGTTSLVGIMAIFQIFPALLSFDLGVNDQTSVYISVGAAMLESLTLFLGVYLFGIRRHKYPWLSVGLREMSSKWIVLSIVFGLLAIPLSSLTANLLQSIFGLSTENPQLPFLIPEDLSLGGMFTMAVLVGLIVPFVEELFFRGILYGWLRNRFNIWVGVLVSSAIFGIVHIDFAVAGTAFVLGIILGLVYEYSKSLWSSIIIHAINNGIQILFLYILVYLGETPI